MSSSGRSSAKYRWWFACAFVTSLIVLAVSLSLEEDELRASAPATSGDSHVGFAGSLDSLSFFSVVSIATSVATFFGFVITNGIAWRKERREGDIADLEIEKKKLELESLRLDIETKRLASLSRNKDST
ncbi:hypothetical protein NJH78_05325 [Pseudomonas chlororaphis]|uniref:hypothetical protein n=1 Tax=Pseudomonas chlororaphis TaxID=587753 RepID=UPI00209B54A6|nr:hypothetical protein [Pseudomonas chlororaphis]MCO7569387.1 hypothetical protein [Pseudomonas chlororaphis]MCO7586768.1 hypothetical protein [Pseudomonas chlororaphis]